MIRQLMTCSRCGRGPSWALISLEGGIGGPI